MAPKAAKIDSGITLKPSEAAHVIRHMVEVNIRNAELGRARRSLFLWGPPGIAKSSVVRQVAKDLNYKLIDVRLTQMEPTDLRGIPVPVKQDNGKIAVEWAAPKMFPKRDAGLRTATILKDDVERTSDTDTQYNGAIILLDELPNAAPTVQAGSYQLVLDGELGEYIVPDNVIVLAAGNRETDKGSTFKMPTPLMNRFTHVEMRSDFDDWQIHALNSGFHKDVVGYLTSFKHELFEFNPTSASRGFPTPRSWDMVSDILKLNTAGLSEIELFALISGTIGEGITHKFMEFRKAANKLPSPSDVLDGKVTDAKDAKSQTSLSFALTTALCYELKDRSIASKEGRIKREDYDKSFDNFLGFMMGNFTPEIIIMGARTALRVFQLQMQPGKLKNFQEFADKYADLVLHS